MAATELADFFFKYVFNFFFRFVGNFLMNLNHALLLAVYSCVILIPDSHLEIKTGCRHCNSSLTLRQTNCKFCYILTSSSWAKR